MLLRFKMARFWVRCGGPNELDPGIEFVRNAIVSDQQMDKKSISMCGIREPSMNST